MLILELFLLILGLVLILVGAFNVPVPRVSLPWLGIFFVVIAFALKVYVG